MKRLVAILLLVVFALSIIACNSGSKKKTKNTVEKTPQKAEQAEVYSPEEEPPQVTFPETTTLESVAYTAYGNFSEHKAFVLVNGKGAYINDDFKLLFELSPEAMYGYDFHEGYAVVTDWAYFSEFYYDDGSRPYHGDVYAMIDGKGNYVIEPGKYGWISRVSNGKYLWWNKKESYTGTVYEMGMNDVKTHNTICRFDLPTKFVPSSPEFVFITDDQILLTGYSNDYYEKAGTGIEIKIDYVSSLQFETLYSFDYNGNRTLMPFPDYLNQKYFNKGSEFKRLIKNGIMVCRDQKRGWFMIVDIFNRTNLNSSGTEYCITDRSVAAGKYMIAQKYARGSLLNLDEFAIIDSRGNVVSTQVIDGVYNTIQNVDDNLWIAPFKNKFYGVLKVEETNGKPEIKFAIEPIQLKDDSIYAYELVYIGERKFLNQMTNEILDENGNIVGRIQNISFSPDLVRQIQNGYFMIEDYEVGRMNGRYYVSSNGTVITEITK